MDEHQLDPFDALDIVRAEEGRFLGGGDVRIGDFILLVDSDTRIPVDCILPTVSELLQSPQVGFTQHLIAPMQVHQIGRSCSPNINNTPFPWLATARHASIDGMQSETNTFRVLQVSYDYFENAMAFFTVNIYTAIKVIPRIIPCHGMHLVRV